MSNKVSSSSGSSSSGIGFIGVLQIVFITLKLLGKIQWSWFWVLSPTIFSTIIIFVLLAFVFIKYSK